MHLFADFADLQASYGRFLDRFSLGGGKETRRLGDEKTWRQNTVNLHASQS
jgi:hypothetical protein